MSITSASVLAAHEALDAADRAVARAVSANLEARLAGNWRGSDDDLFVPFAEYADLCWQHLLPHRAARVWLVEIRPLVEKAERDMATGGTGRRIHKGSPYYNVGLSFFMAGDLEHALQFIGESGIEDEKTSGVPSHRPLLGDHPLAGKILLDPIAAWASGQWRCAYRDITGNALDKHELRQLLDWLATGKLVDAIQVVVSLHRLARVQVGFENDAVKHLRVRALADLVLVIESSLRAWQAGVSGQLHARMGSALRLNPTVLKAFQDAHKHLMTALRGAPRDSAIGLNRAVDAALRILGGASSVADRAGGAACLAVWLRNSLMHVMDDTVSIYQDKAKLKEVAGVALSGIRLSQSAEDGSLANL